MVTGRQICQTRTADFQSTKIVHWENGKKGNGKEVSISMTKVPDRRPVNEENMLSLSRMNFKFLNKAQKYAQYHIEIKQWNQNETLQYLWTCCFVKIVAFNAVEAFWTRSNISLH